jgi:hypothetical protein
MCAENGREREWLKSLREAPRSGSGDWPRLVLWDFLGACGLAAMAALLVILVGA